VRAALALTGGNNGPEIKTDQPSPEATPKVFASRRLGKRKGIMRGKGPTIAWLTRDVPNRSAASPRGQCSPSTGFPARRIQAGNILSVLEATM